METWLDEQLRSANLPEWAFHWTEECFADVYGCLIAGKHIAESALEMASTASLDEYFEDDGEHPIPALRPLIYAAVMEKLSGFDQEEVTDFRSQWESLRGQRPLQERLRVHTPSVSAHKLISQAEIGNALRQMVAVILKLPPLCLLAQSTSRLDQGVWAYSLQEMEAAQLEQAVDTTLPELTTNGNELVITKDASATPLSLRKLGVTPHDDLRIELTTTLADSTTEVVKRAFDRAIDFGGWTVKGPIGKTH